MGEVGTATGEPVPPNKVLALLSHRAQEAYRRRMLMDVGAVRQVDEDGVHVLHVCDDDGQVGQRGQGPGLVLILGGQKYTPSVKSCCGHAHIYTTHTPAHTTPRSTNMCPHILSKLSHTPAGKGIRTWKFKNSGTHSDRRPMQENTYRAAQVPWKVAYPGSQSRLSRTQSSAPSLA